MRVNEFSQIEHTHATGIQVKKQNVARTLGSGSQDPKDPNHCWSLQGKHYPNLQIGFVRLYTSHGILQAAPFAGCLAYEIHPCCCVELQLVHSQCYTAFRPVTLPHLLIHMTLGGHLDNFQFGLLQAVLLYTS